MELTSPLPSSLTQTSVFYCAPCLSSFLAFRPHFPSEQLSVPPHSPSTVVASVQTTNKPENSFFSSLNAIIHSTTARVIFPKHKTLTHLPCSSPTMAPTTHEIPFELPHQANKTLHPVCSHYPIPLLMVSNTPHPAAGPCCSRLHPVLPLYPPALAVAPTKHALLLPLCIPSPVRVPRQAPLALYSVAHV